MDRRQGVSALVLAAITLACLLPFAGKAFHMDDPLFIWTARQISVDPLDFYGFKVNWEGTLAPMSLVTQNPPLAAYYLALVALLAGWSEVALHAGFLMPAVAVVLGTHRLARHFCAHPFWAALGVVAAPVFVVSSTSVMCDTMMLAFWVWALVFWIEGLQRDSRRQLVLSVLFVAAASLTKYFGVALVPLLLVYAWLEERPARAWAPCLLLPVAILGAYQWWTYDLYGRGLLWNAVAYATQLQVGGELPSKLLSTFAFTGGGMALLLFAAPWLWDVKRLAIGVAGFLAIVGLAVTMGKVGIVPVMDAAGGVRWSFVLQLSLWVVAGASAVVLAAADWRQRKGSASVLLFLWVAGTLLFTGLVNWAVSGRNILPMLPAVSLLIVRRLEACGILQEGARPKLLYLPVALSVALAMLVAQADYRLAAAAREAAQEIKARAGSSAKALKFEGHWGFQYYMEALGATALDERDLRLAPNDAVVVPLENSYFFPLPAQIVEPWFTHEIAWSRWLSTMDGSLGAGYYADGWGPLPFVFARVPREQYAVYRVR